MIENHVRKDFLHEARKQLDFMKENMHTVKNKKLRLGDEASIKKRKDQMDEVYDLRFNNP